MAYRLALVLAGGGVRCMAHAGVFIELERAGIVPDLIVGSSLGSVMGGVYAYKPEAEFLRQFALRFSDNHIVRAMERSFAHHPGMLARIGRCGVYSLGLAYISWQYGILSSAFLKRAFNNIVGKRMLRDRNFLIEDCRIPFAPLAVDIASARAVILRSGDIPDAMYASSAVPGVCKPHRLGGMRLMDGGLASLVPVLAAHLLGAERIIAVDTDSKVRGRYDNVVQMIEQASAVRGYRWNMMETAQADLLIEPRVKQFYWWQFSRAEDCIKSGQDAARDSLDAVRSLIARVPDERKQATRSFLAGYYPHVIIDTCHERIRHE